MERSKSHSNGTNGIRLLEFSIPLEENTGHGSFILKFDSAKALIRTLRKHRKARLYIYADGRVRSFAKETNFVFIGALIPAKYPDYQSLFETAIDTRIEISVEDFRKGIREILPYVDPEDNNRLSIAGHGPFFPQLMMSMSTSSTEYLWMAQECLSISMAVFSTDY